MSAGTEWIVNAAGCAEDRLRDLVLLRRICDDILSDLRLTVADGPLWRKFPAPGGVTGLYLLTESHLACHTFPAHGLATFNVYCCSQLPEWPWKENLERELAATVVDVSRIDRGEAVIERALEHRRVTGAGGKGPLA